MRTIVFLFFLLFTALSAYPQVQGLVLDSATKEPLPFVNILDPATSEGQTTNFKGKFSFDYTPEKLRFSFVGYKPKIVNVDKKRFVVRLNASTQNLDTLEILPGVNPAHRIINNVIENKDRNRPDGDSSYSCNSFNRFVAKSEVNNKVNIDSLVERDTSFRKVYDFFKKQHLFLMETSSSRYYKPSGKYREKIHATKTAGIESPMFAAMASQFQPFTFYDNHIEIFGKKYLSPLAPGSTRRYIFTLKDTAIIDQDSIFTIAYQPEINANYQGLKGLLFINSRKWALTNVLASPHNASSGSLVDYGSVQITQEYEEIQQNFWFPKQLKISMKADIVTVSGVPLMIENVTKISNIEIGTALDTVRLGSVNVQVEPGASDKDSSYWQKARGRSLDQKEQKTYKTIDSVSKAQNLERKLNTLLALTSGEVRLGFFDLNLLKVIDYNNHEGFRLGVGGHTNERLIPWMQVGGYFGYGFKDQTTKYGGHLKFKLYDPRKVHLRASYNKDVRAVGNRPMQVRTNLLNPEELYSSFFIEDMDDYHRISLRLSGNVAGDVRLSIFSNLSRYLSNQPAYNFLESEADQRFTSLEAGTELHWGFNSKKIQLPDGMFTLKKGNPQLNIHFAQGLKTDISDLSYTRLYGKWNHKIDLLNWGSINYQVNGQSVWGEVPRTLLFYGYGTNKGFGIVSINTFETMVPLEFLSDNAGAVHFSYKTLPLRTNIEKWFRPQLDFRTSFGIGLLNRPMRHDGINFKTMEKGFWESGIVIHHLLRVNTIGLGAGVFYRYGPYRFNKVMDNFVFKISLRIDTLI